MKKSRIVQWSALVLVIMLLPTCPVFAAAGQTYNFSEIYASLVLDTSPFDVVLTPDNLSQNSTWIAAQGFDPDGFANSFIQDGILLEAHDSKNNRVLVVTALKSVDGEQYFDLNTQDETMRRNYRHSHTDGSAYGLLGYDYSSATWRNYGTHVDRFLRLKYTLKIGGEVQHRGYQRRTIRNGYTITLDLQVTGRSLKDSDEKYLDKVMSGFSFTTILDAPAGECKLNISSDIPKETSSSTLTITGTSTPGATVTATLISMTSATSTAFSDKANSKGKFTIKLTFPEQATFSLLLTAATDTGNTTQRTYTTMYQRNYLPFNLKAEPPAQLTGDSLTIAGSTISGAKVQISVSGPVSYQKSKTGSSFSFSVDTSKEGEYQILITVSKKGLNTRSFSYTATRSFTQEESIAKLKKDAINPTYSKLTADLAGYAGKTFEYTGYILEVNATSSSEWILKLALSKSGTTYKNVVFAVTKQEPAFDVLDKVSMYATLSADPYIESVEGGKTSEYPRFELILMEPAA